MVIELNKTLDQELLALMRGASLECPACGEFVLRTAAGIICPECGARCLKEAETKVQLGLQAG
jgi:predicted RNA-binding Zn-ribbon protein involved in translation (DUF1610 family)